MIREWWNNKSAKEKWKIKAGIAWFGGGLAILMALNQFLFMPKINAFLAQASPAELLEVDAWIDNQMMWVIGIVLVVVIISIIINIYCSRKPVVR